MPKSFPVAMFVQQYGEAGHGPIQASQVRVHALRSKKHATVEVSMPTRTEGKGDPGRIAAVAKYFEGEGAKQMIHERDVLSHAASEGIPVPKILHALGNFLVLEKVEGTTLMDVINDDAVQLARKKDLVTNLGTWLSKFHETFASSTLARRRGDSNLRNFIMTGTGAIVGLDFEEADLDDPLVDLYEVVDSVLQSHPGIYSDGMPAIGWKFDLCECLLRSYATGVRKPILDIIKDPAAFIDAQIRVMQELAAIRGTTGLLTPLMPAIKKELGLVMDRLLGHHQ